MISRVVSHYFFICKNNPYFSCKTTIHSCFGVQEVSARCSPALTYSYWNTSSIKIISSACAFSVFISPTQRMGSQAFSSSMTPRRLHHAGQHGVHALRCGLVKAGGGIKIPHRLFLPLYSGQVIGPCPAGAPVSSARAGYCPIHGGGQRLRSGQSLPPSFPGKTARKCLYAIK